MPSQERVLRPSWDRYFMGIALAVSERSTCDRKHVGAVIVFDKRIISTGYNGSISGAEHCDDVGHQMNGGHCIRTVHAEANAICQAAKFGISTDGADIYTTTYPCLKCFQLIVNSGIKRIIYSSKYGTPIGELVDLSKIDIQLDYLPF